MTRTDDTVSLAEILCALSFASDLAMGQVMEHGIKSGYLGLRIADALGLGPEEAQGVFYGALLKDAGCTATASVVATLFGGDELVARRDCFLVDTESVRNAVAWVWRHAQNEPSIARRLGRLATFMTEGQEVMTEGLTASCEVGEMFARRLGLPPLIQDTVRYSWERWDGRGMPFGRKAADLPVAARVLHLSQIVEVAHDLGGEAAAIAVASERQGSDFDPAVVAAFRRLAARSDFWPILRQAAAQETILAMKPFAPFDRIPESRIDLVCEVLADFADLKSRNTRNHSLEVAETAVAIGRRLGLPPAQVSNLRRSALVEDLGIAAVPAGILHKRDERTAAEWERYRLHPYFTERILVRIGPLANLVPDAISHHEWVDGTGYHRGIVGEQIPLGGRILAVADSFVTESRLDEEGNDPQRVLRKLQATAGSHLDVTCYEALAGSRKGPRPTRARPRDARAGRLTEREVELLRLVGAGLTNRKIAQQLGISDRTVEHHLDNIFNKLGVSTRTSAVVFAVHQGLIQ
ncbi:MAG TPA: HD domain-containing phosphohydrolase [Chloroflexota bacterium]|nr:HD domain-containing phosphohydrolase [Chloroflexota bacterium]